MFAKKKNKKKTFSIEIYLKEGNNLVEIFRIINNPLY